ncbi:MAG: hypothetical protein GF308_18225 [Candidatus Heimdallarchaeota archaeon]|nr:hypothetical protein [Candidatus Heimdallarchaeota archaeon]
MFFHTIRFSWHFPINFSLIRDKHYREHFKWIKECSHGEANIKNLGGGTISSFGGLTLTKRSLKPIIDRYYKIRLKKQLNFPPNFQFATSSTWIPFDFKGKSATDFGLSSVYYRMKCYPIGGIVLDLLFNFKQKPYSKEISDIKHKIVFGKEKKTLKGLIHSLLNEILKSIFEKELHDEMISKISLPNPTYNLFMNTNEDLNRKELKKIASNIFPAIKRNDSSVLYAYGETNEDFIMIHKSGTAFHSSSVFPKEMKSSRRNLKRNLDYLFDLGIISEKIFDRFLNFQLTEYIGEIPEIFPYLDIIIASCDPNLLAHYSQNEALLPTQALRVWYRLISKTLILRTRQENALEKLFDYFEKFHVMDIVVFLKRYLNKYFPNFDEKFTDLLDELDISIPQDPIESMETLLSEQELKVLKQLEKYAKDDLEEIGKTASHTRLEEIERKGVGARIISRLSEDLEMAGRDYYELRTNLGKLVSYGYAKIQPTGRRGSLLYRINISHPSYQLKYKKFFINRGIDISRYQ